MISKHFVKIENSPILKAMTLSVIKIIKSQRMIYEKKEIINSDLIPPLSEKIVRSKIMVSGRTSIENLPKKTNLEILSKPINMKPRQIKQPAINQMTQIAPYLIAPQIQHQNSLILTGGKIDNSSYIEPILPSQSQINTPKQSYGKIDGLLRDPSITYIECSGEEKPLIILRAGQRQITKIILNPLEIKQLLEKVSQLARIPLMEGIFRAAVDNFVMNAVISEVIGSRFVIKKQTPYNLIDPRFNPR